MMKNKQNLLAILFWFVLAAILVVLGYFMIHNAAWLFGDEAIVYSTTGMGKSFSPSGFDCMIECFGRFYPFAYNLYNVLLIFNSGPISAEAHYALHVVALSIFAICFAITAINLLKNYSSWMKYSIVLCFTTIAIFRVLPEFITCYTGIWIVFLLLSIFILCLCKFEQTEQWKWGVFAILSVTYICYCYENICIIPIMYGACQLLFSYKTLSNRKKLFNGLLLASGLLFLLLYVVIVLPRATNFYGHHHETTTIMNAFKMLLAHKIYWVALIFLLIRLWDILKNKKAYIFADSLLLTSFAYFCGTAFLKLNFVYYYNVGALIALVAILCYCEIYLKPHWGLLFMLSLSVLFGRKIPSLIEKNQENRINSSVQIAKLTEYVRNGYSLYWYAPEYEDASIIDNDLRNWSYNSLLRYLEWYTQDSMRIINETTFDLSKVGIWLNSSINSNQYPNSDSIFINYKDVYQAANVSGYLIQ